MISGSRLAAAFGLLISIWVGVGDPLGLGPDGAPVAGLILAAITLYATGVVAEHLTALLFFAVAMIFAVAPPSLVFSGFATQAFWLVLSGLVIGAAIHATGLGARVARLLSRLFPQSYAGLLGGLAFVAMAISFFMPSSMGRIVLLMPIALALADRYGLAEGTKARAGIALLTGFCCFNAPNGILPATVPNMVFIGAVQDAYGFAPLYGEWLLLHFPFLGAFKALVIFAVAWLLFRGPVAPSNDTMAEEPWTGAEKRLAAILVFALVGWATDVVHGISPAWIGLAAAILALLPGVGVLGRDAFKKIDAAPPIYVAGILALGALIADSGLGARLGAEMAAILPLAPGQDLLNYYSLAFGGGVTSLFTTMPGLPAVMVPLAEPLREASGFQLETMLATVVLSYSTTILPYQAPPIILAMSLSGAKMGDAVKLVGCVAIVSYAVILPLNFVWWQILALL